VDLLKPKRQRRTGATWSGSGSGAVLLEAAVVIPFLVFFITGMTDITRLFLLNLRLTTICYEGARYASGLADLETNPLESDPVNIAALPQDRRHTRLHERMALLFNQYGLPYHRLRSSLSREDPALPFRVEIKLRAPFSPFLLKGLNSVEVQCEMPYLYRLTF